MPIKYLPPIPETPKEFVEPNATDHFIWFLFKHRCVKCRKPATEINEILPRSRSKKSISTWENRVTMCAECHREYHRKGVNDKSVEELQKIRYDFLKSMGREEYADYIPLEKIEWGTSTIDNTLDMFMKEQAIKIASVFGVPKELLE